MKKERALAVGRWVILGGAYALQTLRTVFTRGLQSETGESSNILTPFAGLGVLLGFINIHGCSLAEAEGPRESGIRLESQDTEYMAFACPGGEDRVVLYRAVDGLEYSDLIEFGQLRHTPRHTGVKYVAETASDAFKWGELLIGKEGQDFAVIRITLPRALFDERFLAMNGGGNVDNIGRAWTVDTVNDGLLDPSAINIRQVKLRCGGIQYHLPEGAPPCSGLIPAARGMTIPGGRQQLPDDVPVPIKGLRRYLPNLKLGVVGGVVIDAAWGTIAQVSRDRRQDLAAILHAWTENLSRQERAFLSQYAFDSGFRLRNDLDYQSLLRQFQNPGLFDYAGGVVSCLSESAHETSPSEYLEVYGVPSLRQRGLFRRDRYGRIGAPRPQWESE